MREFGIVGDGKDILFESDKTRYWRTFARGGIYRSSRAVEIMFGKMTSIDDIELRLESNVNLPRNLTLYGTDDGRVFYFLQEVTEQAFVDEKVMFNFFFNNRL